MFGKLIHPLPNHCDSIKNRTVFLGLFLIAFFIRLPFFFRDYIDRDESTFILMGQSWVDGHLPYTELWDLKPPIIFLFFASIIYTFGKSFFAIRLCGTLIVALTAFFTYKIGEKTQSKKIGLWSAIGSVCLLSLFGSLQGVMSEHICMFFFMPALYLLLCYDKFWIYCCAGLLLGLAVMSKLNIAYAIFFLALYLVYTYYRDKKMLQGIVNMAGMGTAIILVIALTLLPYYLQGKLETWWNSVILAPIEYAASQQNPIYKTAPFCLTILIFLFLTWKKSWLDFDSRKVRILVFTVLGIVLMFLLGGKVNGHYLIQFHPVFIVPFTMVVSRLSLTRHNKITNYLWVLLLLIPMESYVEYISIIKKKLERGTFYNGEGIDIPRYLNQHGLETQNVLFLEYHIGYWSLNGKPPTKAATHPSNILREAMFPYFSNPRKTGMDELRYIMQTIKPKIVVTRKNRRVFDKKQIEANTYINNYLKTHYKALKTLDAAVVHQRLK